MPTTGESVGELEGIVVGEYDDGESVGAVAGVGASVGLRVGASETNENVHDTSFW